MSKTYQKGNYVVNHRGEVWCLEQNEMIYSDTFANCVEFVNNIIGQLDIQTSSQTFFRH